MCYYKKCITYLASFARDDDSVFVCSEEMDLYPGARGYRISNTPVMLTVALQGALQVR